MRPFTQRFELHIVIFYPRLHRDIFELLYCGDLNCILEKPSLSLLFCLNYVLWYDTRNYPSTQRSELLCDCARSLNSSLYSSSKISKIVDSNYHQNLRGIGVMYCIYVKCLYLVYILVGLHKWVDMNHVNRYDSIRSGQHDLYSIRWGRELVIFVGELLDSLINSNTFVTCPTRALHTWHRLFDF